VAAVLIPIYFDYASTLCYVAWRIVGQLETELGFEALWKGVPIARHHSGARRHGTLDTGELQKIMAVSAETGIPVSPPKRWADSLKALQGAELARQAGVFADYHEAIFRAAFEQGSDIGSLDLLAEVAERVGMDRAGFVRDISSGKMAGLLEDHEREADRFSVIGYPTFLLGDFPLTGIQSTESMRLLLGRFLEIRSKEPQA